MRSVVILTLGLLGCGAPPKPKTHRVNPGSVPSLSLLDAGSERRTEVTGSGAGRSCEDVIDEQRRAAAASGLAEEPPAEHGEEIRAILNDGTYIASCDVPDWSNLELCVAIINGYAEGVTVVMTSALKREADCVADQIRRLEFPSHELVSVARTQFAPQ